METYETLQNKPCANLCRMCPSCAFTDRTPFPPELLWTIGDSFHRMFLVDLLSRSRSVIVLKKVQRVLSMTSLTMYCNPSSTSSAPKEKPFGFNGHEARKWFDSSSEWTKSRYVCSLFLDCDVSLLKALANLANALLVRAERGILSYEECNTYGESDEPTLILRVVPMSSASYSGISVYKDFIRYLPAKLAKKILGFLDRVNLKRCMKVSQMWRIHAKDTLYEMKFRKEFTKNVMKYTTNREKDPLKAYDRANFVKVQVPDTDDKSCGEKDHLKMKLVQMEERNIYCRGYLATTNIIKKQDPHRVLDYRGQSLMAVVSSGKVLQLLHASGTSEATWTLQGARGLTLAVCLCEERDLVITAGVDGIIRCWNLKSQKCVLSLSGHTGAVNCLDVSADRLASGGQDRAVKIWSLQQEAHCDQYKFKHRSSIVCVKINRSRVYSSCHHGKVQIWSLDKASVLKVIDAHHSPVRCLSFDKWHLVTGDAAGLVMAWSTSPEARDVLGTFKHPKGVNSLALAYLRVVTACDDGYIRIFHFLTGECFKVLGAGCQPDDVLSVHFHQTSILVNCIEKVMLHDFGEVVWIYANPSAEGKSVRTGEGQRSKGHSDSVKVAQSRRTTSERVQKRGTPHPPTRAPSPRSRRSSE